MTHTIRLAVAMGSVLEFRREPGSSLQDAYETVAGGGCVEIYQEIADLAVVAGRMLDEIEDSKLPLSWPGCFDYEVVEEACAKWQRLVIEAAKADDEDLPNVLPFLGRRTLEFFTKDGANAEHKAAIADIVYNHTGYREQA